MNMTNGMVKFNNKMHSMVLECIEYIHLIFYEQKPDLKM